LTARRCPALTQCGLDFGAREGLAGREAQLEAFRAQLRLGVELRRPVSVRPAAVCVGPCVVSVGALPGPRAVPPERGGGVMFPGGASARMVTREQPTWLRPRAQPLCAMFGRLHCGRTH